MKIAICMPTGRAVKPRTLTDLTVAMAHTSFAGHTVGVVSSSGGSVEFARNKIAQDALDKGADALMWWDSDVFAQRDVIVRLLAHDLPMVGCHYPLALPTRQFARVVDFMNPVDQTSSLAEVNYLPGGCNLVRREIYEKLEAPWYELGYGMCGLPSTEYTGEDLYFGWRVRGAGFHVWCDMELSKTVGHTVEVDMV
jgi:GT2 family glycosyltransferase